MFKRLLLISALVFTACERNTRATVNGVALSADPRLSGVERERALNELVDEELQAQRATALGYAPEGPLAGATGPSRRHDLAKQFRMTELLGKATVSPDEARAWFDANTARVQSEFQVQFLKVQGRATGQAVLAALRAGQPFDDVAAAQFPKAPEPKPWAVQPMRWAQVPPPWWPELDRLEVGKTSGLIADVQDRYWVVKLVARRQTAPVTFEVAEPAITATLRAKKFEERRDRSMKELRAAAQIEWSAR